MFELAFGKFSMARKPIISGGAIRPTGLLSISAWFLNNFNKSYFGGTCLISSSSYSTVIVLRIFVGHKVGIFPLYFLRRIDIGLVR